MSHFRPVTDRQIRMLGKIARDKRTPCESLQAAIDNGSYARFLDSLKTGSDKCRAVVLRDKMNPIIHVDRSVKPPVYPDWIMKALYPKLELTGPTEFDIRKVEQWLHDGQKNGGSIEGQLIFKHLKDAKMLESCLGLLDLLEIKRRGVAFFRKYFGDNTILAWRSISWNRNVLYVPSLRDGDGVVLEWNWLGHDLGSDCPALRFPTADTKSGVETSAAQV